MLLIGSQAAKFHYPFFRRPKDFDFIASIPEVEHFKSLVKYKDISNHEKKVKLEVELDKPTFFEFDLIEHCTSSKILYMMKNNVYSKNKHFNIVYQVRI